MELRQLQCMVICAQTKSFSKAASMLFTSQSNVSKTIAALEKELGKKIFERRRHGIELTAKGEQIYKYALSMVECSAKILDCAEEDATEELRVSFQPSSWFANTFCEYYIQESAGEKYNIISAPAEEIIRRIIANQDQLGFAYFEDSQLDKLKKSQVEPALQVIRETLELGEGDILIPFSAEKGTGKEELISLLTRRSQ